MAIKQHMLISEESEYSLCRIHTMDAYLEESIEYRRMMTGTYKLGNVYVCVCITRRYVPCTKFNFLFLFFLRIRCEEKIRPTLIVHCRYDQSTTMYSPLRFGSTVRNGFRFSSILEISYVFPSLVVAIVRVVCSTEQSGNSD